MVASEDSGVSSKAVVVVVVVGGAVVVVLVDTVVEEAVEGGLVLTEGTVGSRNPRGTLFWS